MLLQNQRDLFQQHIDATLETDEDADISELKKTKEEVEKALHVVQEHLLISREAFVKETQTDRQLMARL
jgi:divalent metal cation (Fe/Co/Zn/Cd) transporter